MSNVDDYPFIYQNTMPVGKKNFIKIKFYGSLLNKDGIGSRVSLVHGKNRQIQEQYLTRGYQSAVNKIMHFGLGQDSIIDQLKISWPDGKIQLLEYEKSNQELKLQYTDAIPSQEPTNMKKLPLFEENFNTPLHQHRENEYDDFVNEGLLPYKTSHLGPGLAVGDVDENGMEDFYIGGAKGQSGALFLQKSNGKFKRAMVEQFMSDKGCEDIEATFFDADSDGDLDLYVVSGGNEFAESDPLLMDRLYLNEGNGSFLGTKDHLPEIKSSNSCVKPIDFDNDGDLDLFIGGRLIPGKISISGQQFST